MSGLREATKNADVAQSVEYILGKDEVVGSIPIVSSITESRKTACKAVFRVFAFARKKQDVIRNSVFFGIYLAYYVPKVCHFSLSTKNTI